MQILRGDPDITTILFAIINHYKTSEITLSTTRKIGKAINLMLYDEWVQSKKSYFRQNRGGKNFLTGPDSCRNDLLLMRI